MHVTLLLTTKLYACVCTCVWYTNVLLHDAPPLSGFECYSNSYYDSSCVGQKNATTCLEEGSACEVLIQYNPAVGNYTYQGCVEGFLNILACQERLVKNPGSSIPYSYCCKEELCNSKEALQQQIAGGEPSSTVTLPAGSNSSFYCHKIAL